MPVASPRHARAAELVALGAAIRRARVSLNISQEGLAHLSNLDRSYMSSVERGMQNPSLLMVLQIAQALGKSGADLLAEADL